MNSNLQQFFEQLCIVDNSKQNYAYKSVLNGIPIDKFVSAVEELSNTNKKDVFETLSSRYRNQVSTSMNQEVEWIHKVFDAIEEKHKDIETIDDLVMMKVVEWTKQHVKTCT